tara:strand:+ start:722 stop:1048 length:327 start_codon:yes stop_codon:yes gene_type:complete
MGEVIQNRIKRSKNWMIGAIRREKECAFRLAYTFGSISPKIKIKVVTMPISINKSKNGLFIPINIFLLKMVNKRTIAILMKLLATKIVAKRRFGFFNRDITRKVPGVI